MNIGDLGDYGLALAGIVAGFGAIGWAGKNIREGYKWALRLGRTVDALNDLAQYELNHNGGGSIKDHAAKVPALVDKVDGIERRLGEHLDASVAASTAATAEANQMWAAIEAVAKAQPPEV